jgi:hypothetical protein
MWSLCVQGSELFNNYGTTKPNEELLLGFGFVLDQNPNDAFLVSISHPPQAMTHPDDASVIGPGDDVSNDDEAADVAAVWQRRLAAMRLAAMQLDVPITAAEPLPQNLLYVMLLAAALPAAALPAAAAAGQSVGEGSLANQQQQQQQQDEEQRGSKRKRGQQQQQYVLPMSVDGPLADGRYKDEGFFVSHTR